MPSENISNDAVLADKFFIKILLKKGEWVWFDGQWQKIKEDSVWSRNIFDDDESIFQFPKERLKEAIYASLDQNLERNRGDTSGEYRKKIIDRCEILLFSYSYRRNRWLMNLELNDCGLPKRFLIKLKLFFYPVKETDFQVAFIGGMVYLLSLCGIAFWLEFGGGISSDNSFVYISYKVNSLIPVMETHLLLVKTDKAASSLAMATGWLFGLPTIMWLIRDRYHYMEDIFINLIINSSYKALSCFASCFFCCFLAFFFINMQLILRAKQAYR